MKYLNGTRNFKLRLQVENLSCVKYFVDAAFTVHNDFRSYTGGVIKMGKGAITSISKKQKMNTRSSTTAELVAADDVIGLILWTKLFLEAQGYEINRNVLFQDNKSTILLEENGKKSSGKRTRHLNMCYFFFNRSN